jgi:hypothetical protein
MSQGSFQADQAELNLSNDCQTAEVQPVSVREQSDRHIRRVRTSFFSSVAVLIGSIFLLVAVASEHRHRPLPEWLPYAIVGGFSTSLALFALGLFQFPVPLLLTGHQVADVDAVTPQPNLAIRVRNQSNGRGRGHCILEALCSAISPSDLSIFGPRTMVSPCRANSYPKPIGRSRTDGGRSQDRKGLEPRHRASDEDDEATKQITAGSNGGPSANIQTP